MAQAAREETFEGTDGLNDLLNDIGKEGVMADVTAWIDKRLSA